MGQRNSSVDIAKGLLVMGVVYYHMFTILTESCGIESPTFRTMYNLHVGYTVFFMPAFFVLTGYCSNFTRSFGQFLLTNVRAILVPMLMLNLIPCLLSFNVEALRFMIDGTRWLWGLSFWFLPSLFLAKLFFWPIAHYVTDYRWSWGLSILCLIVALTVQNFHIGTNYWYWKPSLAYVFFMQIGHWLRQCERKDLVMKIGAVVYISTFPLWLFMYRLGWPNIGLSISCSWNDVVPYLISSISGCLCVMYVSTLIGKNAIIEYVGKASLVVYCSHWFIAQHIGKYLNFVIPVDNSIKAVAFYLISFVIAVVLSCFLYRIYDTKYLRWIIGKKNI